MLKNDDEIAIINQVLRLIFTPEAPKTKLIDERVIK